MKPETQRIYDEILRKTTECCEAKMADLRETLRDQTNALAQRVLRNLQAQIEGAKSRAADTLRDDFERSDTLRGPALAECFRTSARQRYGDTIKFLDTIFDTARQDIEALTR